MPLDKEINQSINQTQVMLFVHFQINNLGIRVNLHISLALG